MFSSSPKPRCIVEKSDDFVRVTIPSKITLLRVLFVCVWFALWGYMVTGSLTVKRQIDLGLNSDDVFLFASVCFSFFLLALLGLGVFALYRAGWLFAGKELIQATPQALTVTKQIFRWGKSKVYSADKIMVCERTHNLYLCSFRRRESNRLLGGSGMIAFEYEKRTITVGQEISEAEANHIIDAFQEKLLQKNAS